MRRWIGTGVLLLVLLGIGYALLSGRHERRLIDATGRRVVVADGDTLRIGTETVRLSGMDAVERAQFCTDAAGGAWSCGETAQRALEALVAKGGLRCLTRDRDAHGRAIARCSVAGVDDLGAAMVAAGWAVSDRGGRYFHEEEAAKAAKAGLWAGSFEVPAQWRARHGVAVRRAVP